ncbi:MAG: phosphoglycolate phosphatase [Rhodobacteraceae bacterium]|nr:phosphoglycolate phosphatase [Paracoccaceae bacterium]
MSKAIVFDLDGTLVDSAPDIAAAANRLLSEMGHAGLPVPMLTSFIGHGIPNLVAQVIAACEFNPGLHPEMNARMLALYSERPVELTRPYSGVVATLEQLRAQGFRMGVCTNKYRALSVRILDALDLMPFFDVVIGGDSLAVKKPDPAPLHAAFAALSGTPWIYIGDSEVDAQTAQAAELGFGLFTRGYRKTPVAQLRHDFAFDDFAALPAMLADRAA